MTEFTDRALVIGGRTFTSRLLVGTGKYRTNAEMTAAIAASGAEVVTVAVRRVDLDRTKEEGILHHLDPKRYFLLANTAGCYTADEAVRYARLAREAGFNEFIKLEVIGDQQTLLPDAEGLLAATRTLAGEGFKVMAYTNDDLITALRLEEAGAVAVMPLASPIGSGLGLLNPYSIRTIKARLSVPVIVDAGVGTASDACVTMEQGVDGILMNTALAQAQDAVLMAGAMRRAVEAGRMAFLAGRMPRREVAVPFEPGAGDARLNALTPIAARRAAFAVLEETAAGSPFESALSRAIRDLDQRDGRLTHELAAGVLRRRGDLDLALAPLAERGWESVAPRIRTVLRLGAYQLLELDKVPPHAAVGTSTDLARWAEGERAAKFVNAVLRRLAREGGPAAAPPGSRRSHPAWLLHRWDRRFGVEMTDRLLLWNDSQPALVLQPARRDTPAIAAKLGAGGVTTAPAPWGAGLLVDATRPAELPGYGEGDFIVQDPAQALVARFAALPEGATLYDACAAPGGKAIALGRGARRVLAGDLRPPRVRRLRENLARAGSGREFAIVADAGHPPCRPVDAVLLDAPCLGTGTFARHPDARWRVSAAALRSLAARQGELLEAAAPVVGAEGLLIYATCSLEPEENEVQVERFLERHAEFRREPPPGFPAELCSPRGDLELLPQVHGTDGAFAARLRRRAA